MGKISLKKSNTKLPAPRFWRKLENALLILVIPAMVMVITNWGFKDEALVNRLILILNVLLVAVVKSIGMFLANGEVYTETSREGDDGNGAVIPTKGP